MSSQTVWTVVGYGVGYLIGDYSGATGSALSAWAAGGAAVGGAIGASQQRIRVPGLQDTSIAPSQYGIGIPRIYGNDRVSCAPIWSLPKLIETEHTQSGKGGPKVTTTSYSLSWAVQIAEGPIVGIRRMWFYGKLVYDARPEASPETALESAKFREFFTLYLGTEDQAPDPTIEAVLGVGRVPAYRGLAYIVFTNLPLEPWGNRMPEVSVEVATAGPGDSSVDVDAGDDGTPPVLREPLWAYRWDKTRQLLADPWREDSPKKVPLHSLGDTLYTWVNEPTIPNESTSFETIAQDQAARFAEDGAHTFPAGGKFSYQRAGEGYYYTSTNPEWAVVGGASIDDDPEFLYIKTAHRTPDRKPMPHSTFNLDVPQMTHTPLHPGQTDATWATDVMVWRLEHGGGGAPPSPYVSVPYSQVPYGPGLSTTWFVYMLTVKAKRQPYHPPKSGRPGSPGRAPEGLAELQGAPGYVVDRQGNVSANRKWVYNGGTAKQMCAVEYRDGRLYQNARGPVLLPSDPNYNNSAFWDALYAEYTAIPDPLGLLAREPQTVSNAMHGDVAYPVVVSTWAESTESDGTRWNIPSATDSDTDAAGHVLLADIVASLCQEAGLQSSQLDLAELDDLVIGYTRANRMAAVSALEALRAAYVFDMIQSGGKIVARKRGRSVVATIGPDHLGTGRDAALEERVQSQRGQETELPAVVSIVYRDLDLDYLPGSQEARRQTGESDQQKTLEVPVVMRASQALQLANAHLWSAWPARTRRTVSVPMAYASVEPTDVIEVDDGDL